MCEYESGSMSVRVRVKVIMGMVGGKRGGEITISRSTNASFDLQCEKLLVASREAAAGA